MFSSLARCQAEHRGGKSTSEGHISLLSKGKRRGTAVQAGEPCSHLLPKPNDRIGASTAWRYPCAGQDWPKLLLLPPKAKQKPRGESQL